MIPYEFPVEAGLDECGCPLTILKGWKEGGFRLGPAVLCSLLLRDLGSGGVKSLEKTELSAALVFTHSSLWASFRIPVEWTPLCPYDMRYIPGPCDMNS